MTSSEAGTKSLREKIEALELRDSKSPSFYFSTSEDYDTALKMAQNLKTRILVEFDNSLDSERGRDEELAKIIQSLEQRNMLLRDWLSRWLRSGVLEMQRDGKDEP